jgi:pilus assembly protein Flp/PilA
LLLNSLVSREEGQDLVEYALVITFIALGSAAAMQSLAGAISTTFLTVSSEFAAGI